MSLESLEAPSALWSSLSVSVSWCHQLPHLDGLIQRSGDEILSVWSEGDRVDRVLVSVWAIQTLNKIPSGDVPNSDTLIKGSSSDKPSIWRNSNSRDAILNAERHDVLLGLDIPETDSAITRSRSDGSSISGEVEGVDILLVAWEGTLDSVGGNIPNTDQLVLSTSSEVLSVWTEAHTSNVQIATSINRIILQDAKLLSSRDVEDLCTSVTTSRDIPSVSTEANTADDTLVLKRVQQVDIKNPWHSWVVNGEPVALDLLLAVWKTIQI